MGTPGKAKDEPWRGYLVVYFQGVWVLRQPVPEAGLYKGWFTGFSLRLPKAGVGVVLLAVRDQPAKQTLNLLKLPTGYLT